MKFLATALLAMAAAAEARLLAVNDPRSVEAKDDIKIVEIKDSPLHYTHAHVIRHLLSDEHVHYPECNGKLVHACMTLLRELCDTTPSRFPLIETAGGCNALTAEVHLARARGDPGYNRVVAVPDPTGTWAIGQRKDCLQHYDLPWPVNGVVRDIGPWDCTAPAGQGDPTYGCMAMDDCCTLIRGSEPVDDLGNGLGCIAQPLHKAYEEPDPATIISECDVMWANAFALTCISVYTVWNMNLFYRQC